MYNIIKTHDSELRGQEETAIIRETKNTRPLSELFTRKSVQKLTNILVKPYNKPLSRMSWPPFTYVVVQKGGQVTKPIMHGCEIAILLNYCVHVF